MARYDVVIVGAGLFGSLSAYKYKSLGRKVLVIDKRSHVGGNLYCESIEGINVHKYGAHIFHTSNKKVWDFVNSFVEFNRFTNSPLANYKNVLYNLPFNMNTFYQLWGTKTPAEAKAEIERQRAEVQIDDPKNLEEQALSLVGKDIYEKLIKGYTEKQWGKSPRDLPAFIIKRIPLRYTFDNNYFSDIYQGIPAGGYNGLISKLLEGCEVLCNADFFKDRPYFEALANQYEPDSRKSCHCMIQARILKHQIYIYCPANFVTGGTELLHQLVDVLRNNGAEAYIYYIGEPDAAIPDAFKRYNIQQSLEIVDREDNIVVLPETLFKHHIDIKYARIYLWWLSVDNFYNGCMFNLPLKELFDFSKRMFVDRFILNFKGYASPEDKRGRISLNSLSSERYVSLYQSEYAHHFLYTKGFKYVLPLKDYINTEFYEIPKVSGRENIVLYNPAKGMEYTRQLIRLSPDLEWRPIQGLKRKQLVELLRKSKLYIDFGNHPGKDRLPREAALNGCCLITGIRGAAYFYEDIPIPDIYKLDEKKVSKEDVISLIRNVLADYEKCFSDFNYYRSRILMEKAEFEEDVKKLFLRESV